MRAAKNLISTRKFDSAIEKVKQAIGIDPSKPDAFIFLGNLQEISGDLSEAVKNYRVAVDLDPTCKQAKENLSRATSNHRKTPKI